MPRGGRGTVYKPEFKQMAVELVLSSNKSTRQIATELEVHEKTLSNWIALHKKVINASQSAEQQAKISKSLITTASANTASSDEIKQLKKENARLKMECEILKKATAYFAKSAL